MNPTILEGCKVYREYHRTQIADNGNFYVSGRVTCSDGEVRKTDFYPTIKQMEDAAKDLIRDVDSGQHLYQGWLSMPLRT